ncbi:DUF2945 domain-containing protein [Frigoribacterium sp. 2-23]|uniref:DUF2945 domain-containing protein n=1 Tax=Frigoribacterium sp. 2-23 TaxID=3415006 RepID=UPI003C6F7882
MTFSKGDHVTWKTSQGTTHGTVVDTRTKKFQFDGQQFNASDDEPYYIVKSDKTDAEAAHKGSALTKKK